MHAALVTIIVLVWVSGTVFAAFALFDAFRHTAAEWDAVGQSRPVWVGLLIVGLCGGVFGILPIIYWLTVSPKLKAVATA